MTTNAFHTSRPKAAVVDRQRRGLTGNRALGWPHGRPRLAAADTHIESSALHSYIEHDQRQATVGQARVALPIL